MNNESKVATDVTIKDSPFIRTANRLEADRSPFLIRYSEMDRHRVTFKEELKRLSSDRFNSERSSLLDNHLKKELGLDSTQLTVQSLINEATNAFDLRLFNEYSKSAKKTRDLIKLKTRWSRFLHNFLKIPMIDYSNNPVKHIRFQIARLQSLSYKSEDCFFVVTNISMASLLLGQTCFQYCSSSESESSLIFPYGIVDQKIKIFVNPNLGWDDNSMIVGSMPSPDRDGMYYSIINPKFEERVDYMTENIITSLSAETFIGEVGDDGHLNYIYSNLEIGERPWWRKLIGA